MRPDPPVQQVGGGMGGFVTDDFAQQVGVLGLEQRRKDIDLTRRRPAAAERPPQPTPGLDPDSIGEIGDAPDDRPLREPGVDRRNVHESLINNDGTSTEPRV
jgi:hypothetical protein